MVILMQHNTKSSRTNAAGYLDPTAATAIANVTAEEKSLNLLIYVLKYIIERSGFELVGRIVLKNKESGRVYR